MSSLFDLTGKIAIVTGSTKGIGLAIATRMAEHGATVVISSRKPDACEAVAAGIREKGGKPVGEEPRAQHDRSCQRASEDVPGCRGCVALNRNTSIARNATTGTAAPMNPPTSKPIRPAT